MQKMNQDPISCDLLVVGGGLSGVIAAIAAKRTSPAMTVWLIERYGSLGGMATNGYVYPMMNYKTKNPNGPGFKRIIGGIFQELMTRMHDKGYTEKYALAECYARFDPMMMRCVLDEMIVEAKVNLLLHALVNSVEILNTSVEKHITKIIAQTKAGSIEFHPRLVIDASGDGDVLYHAGAEFILGRESDNLTQPGTLNFRLGNIGWTAPPRTFIMNAMKKAKANGNPLTPRDNILAFMTPNRHELHYNQTRVAQYDFTDPFQMTQAEIEGRRQAERFILFLRNKIRGFKHSSVVGLGNQLGIRETRHFLGDYVLTENDIESFTMFPDRICLGNYPIDIHDPKGSALTDCRRIPPGKYYSIPYRSLIPKNFSNVLIAGRPISASHVAHSAIRVMPICSAIGHGAGVAAGLLFEKLGKDENTSFRNVDINVLQTTLRNQHAVID